MPPVWWRWFQALFSRVGGSPSATLASLSSPTFTGTPVVPTAAPGTNSAQAASTAFVMSIATPPGAVAAFAGASAPTGWLLCNGASVLRADYPALFAAIGTTYGSADASHFNVPDLRSRLPVGAGQGTGLTNRALAATGGEESHTLTAAESGTTAHAHGVTDGGHAHTVPSFPSTGLAAGAANIPASTGSSTLSTSTDATGLTVDAATAAPASQAHENMPPFLALNWIVKT